MKRKRGVRAMSFVEITLSNCSQNLKKEDSYFAVIKNRYCFHEHNTFQNVVDLIYIMIINFKIIDYI